MPFHDMSFQMIDFMPSFLLKCNYISIPHVSICRWPSNCIYSLHYKKKSFYYLSLTTWCICKSFNYSPVLFQKPLQFFSLLSVDVSSALHISEITTSVPNNEVICSLFLLVVPPFIYPRSSEPSFIPEYFFGFCGLHSSFIGNMFLHSAT